MDGMGGYGSSGFGIGINGMGDGPNPTYASPRRTAGQHDLLIVLDIPDHDYVDGKFKTEIE